MQMQIETTQEIIDQLNWAPAYQGKKPLSGKRSRYGLGSQIKVYLQAPRTIMLRHFQYSDYTPETKAQAKAELISAAIKLGLIG